MSKNEAVWPLRHSTKRFVYQHESCLYVFLCVRLGTVCISALIVLLLFFWNLICFILSCCFEPPKKCCCARKGSIIVLFLYAFLTLFQLVPVMCHMVMYPILTLSIIVQYLCSLFIFFLFVYQLIMFIIKFCYCIKYCCRRIKSNSPSNQENEELLEPIEGPSTPPQEPQEQFTSKEVFTHTCTCCMYLVKACLSLLGLVLILGSGFLYFVVMLWE